MAAHFLKRHVHHLASFGSAIVFWHEAQGCPPSVKALPLSDIESLEPGTRVSEKTLCNAKYRDQLYPCVVLWIEEDKTPDELVVARLLPSSNEKIFEDKGFRWAKELRYNINAKSEPIDANATFEDGGASFAEQKALQREQEAEEEADLSEQKFAHGASLEFNDHDYQEERLDMNSHSPAYESSAASASSGTYGSHIRAPIKTSPAGVNLKAFQNQKQGRKQKLPTKACSMVHIVTPAQRMNHESSGRTSSPLEDDIVDDEFESAPSTSAADTTSLAISHDTLVVSSLSSSQVFAFMCRIFAAKNVIGSHMDKGSTLCNARTFFW
jgi:hypothetical protein